MTAYLCAETCRIKKIQHTKNLIVTDVFYLHLLSCRSNDSFGVQK